MTNSENGSDEEVNRMLTDSFSSEPMTLTRITVDEYALGFMTPEFICESYSRVIFHSAEKTEIELSADFRSRNSSGFTVLALVGKTITLARVDDGRLALSFSSGERLVFETVAGRESFAITFADGRGIYLFWGESADDSTR